jgi:hypothetical protein
MAIEDGKACRASRIVFAHHRRQCRTKKIHIRDEQLKLSLLTLYVFFSCDILKACTVSMSRLADFTSGKKPAFITRKRPSCLLRKK